MLSEYQQATHVVPKLHWAFIRGENDDEETVTLICDAVNDVGLHVDVNVVRYNSYSVMHGTESAESTICRNVALVRRRLPGAKVKVIDRVGFDVKASCGMFIESAGVDFQSPTRPRPVDVSLQEIVVDRGATRTG
ncbi:MAG: hypothetical protein IH987_21290 [Planctomycetes bacterium]|nr:hypothetical protein [Planctomycetota bacterium]